LHRSEFTAGEIAEEMEKERKYLQLTTADYLIKVNEIRTKKSVDLLQHLLEYYKAQYRSVMPPVSKGCYVVTPKSIMFKVEISKSKLSSSCRHHLLTFLCWLTPCEGLSKAKFNIIKFNIIIHF
jgi:hypothetical protein